MSTLAAEPNIYPQNLLADFAERDDSSVDSGAGRAWWVLRTKARQEKAIARELTRRQTPFYLPLKAERRFVRGRPVDAYFPMFAGYVFLYGADDERVASLKSNRIVQMLPVTDRSRFVRDLWQVEKLASSNLELTVESFLGPGKRVRVVSGGLEGVEGVVISRRGVSRLFVSVDLIGQGVSLEVDDFMVEPLG